MKKTKSTGPSGASSLPQASIMGGLVDSYQQSSNPLMAGDIKKQFEMVKNR